MAIIKVKTGGITADAITSTEIADNAVVTAAINADAVTDAKIADDVVGTEHLTANEVDTTALGADAVTGAELADNAVNSEHYTDGSIDTAHIADAQITAAKLASGVGGKVLQVVSVIKISAFTATNLGAGAVIDITGVAANITPSSTSSKILISYSVQGVSEKASRVISFATTLKRGGSEITAAIGEAAGNRIRVANFISIRADANDQNVGASLYNTFLDSPSTTSETTYQICLKNIQDTALTYHVNRTYGDANNANYRPRGTSTITLMEIAG